MNWRETREAHRGRLVAKYDVDEARNYDLLVGTLSDEDQKAYLADIQDACPLLSGQSVLDVGAGSGTLSQILCRISGLTQVALEPSSAMCELMRGKPALSNVTVMEGGCDSSSDRNAFPESSFDAIVSRQVVNSLFDPLMAFRNWLYWLKRGGRVVVIDGIYARDGWTGIWSEEVDVVPLSACQSLATIPYLLESVGFTVLSANWMARTNRLASTRTKRYMVIAQK